MKTKKVLIIATIGGFINSFEVNDIDILRDMGFEVHVATNTLLEPEDDISELPVVVHQVNFSRSPFSKKNIGAYHKIKELINREKFDFVHCHTPVGGVVARLAVRNYHKSGMKVIYTAHGFHFFTGAPLKNWILFYPIEWILSYFTDVLVTINKEDYQRAQKTLHANKTRYIHGVGINTEKFCSNRTNRTLKRNELGVKESDIMLLSVGELSTRKNHIAVIKAISLLQNRNIKYYICGEGDLRNYLQETIARLKLTKNVFLLGFRSDISEICQAADCFVFPSLQEGLPVALMEAMACQIPVICSRIRGNTDLITSPQLLFDAKDINSLATCLRYQLDYIQEFPENCQKEIEKQYQNLKEYDIINVKNEMKQIYKILEDEI